MSDFILIYMTCSSEEESRGIVQALLDQHLIACANVFQPHESFYRWEGKLHIAKEVAAILKTREGLFDRVKDEILKLHSYDCPCILKLPVEGGHAAFLDWLSSETH